MRSDIEPPSSTKYHKRALEDDSADSPPTTTQRRVRPPPPLPTPSPTALSTRNPHSKQRKTRRHPSRASPQSEPTRTKRAFEDPDFDSAPASKRRRQSSSAPTWFLDGWLNDTWRSRLVQEKIVKAGEIIPTIENPVSLSSTADSHITGDGASQQDEETATPPSVAAAQSERLNASSPMYRATLKMNNVFVDKLGAEIPQDIQKFLDEHIRKERKSPPLAEDEKVKIRQVIAKVWDKAEPMVSDIIKTTLFPFDEPGIAEGRDTIWSVKPVPRNPDYPLAITAPKTDHHFGFSPSQDSEWTIQELSAADHPKIRIYSQPTRENLFPSFLVEVKSEVTGGTWYAGESQVAGSGAYRVRSLIELLDLVDPKRTRKSTDSLIFSAVVTQRGAIAHVHYYNPEKKMYYMSYIDEFPFLKDAQGCHNHHKNIAEWLLNIQQPAVRGLLSKLHPITKLWKKGRPAGAMTDVAESCASEDAKPSKRQPT